MDKKSTSQKKPSAKGKPANQSNGGSYKGSKPSIPGVFRTWGYDDFIFVLFPTEPHGSDPELCVAYSMTSGYGPANVKGAMKGSRPATKRQIYKLVKSMQDNKYYIQAIDKPAGKHYGERKRKAEESLGS